MTTATTTSPRAPDGPPLPDPKRMDRLYAKAGILIARELQVASGERVRGKQQTAAEFLGGRFLGMTAEQNAEWGRQWEAMHDR